VLAGGWVVEGGAEVEACLFVQADRTRPLLLEEGLELGRGARLEDLLSEAQLGL